MEIESPWTSTPAAAIMSLFESTRSVRSTRSLRRRRWQSSRRAGIKRHHQHMGRIPIVQEMQSEGGAAGVAPRSVAVRRTDHDVHSVGRGPLVDDSRTCSRSLASLTATVFHVAGSRSRNLGAVDLRRPFDVMAVRGTGFAMISWVPCKSARHRALIAQGGRRSIAHSVSSLLRWVRTSHELNTLDLLSDEQIRAMIRDDWFANIGTSSQSRASFHSGDCRHIPTPISRRARRPNAVSTSASRDRQPSWTALDGCRPALSAVRIRRPHPTPSASISS